jgi:hypothetical protein
MGAPPPQARDFNWEALNVQRFNLAALDAPFTSEEILKAISLTPSGKAPGPDGFTTNFFKSCWEIIRGDLVAALNTFHDLRCLNFNLLNTTNIVLLPKKEGAQKIGDYRPTSLIHSVAKLLAKVLALRLAPECNRSSPKAKVPSSGVVASMTIFYTCAI